MKGTISAVIAAVTASVVLVATPSASEPTRASAPSELTNLDHLDFLGDAVTPPAQRRHTTYRMGEDPEIGTLWTYAERKDDGSYRRVGGGEYDPETDTYGQGAFNADDMARAAVVYLRHWKQTGAVTSRRSAYQMLRGLTYLQTASGPDAGNVVLWMQPDGTLNRSADPVELPNPSDSDASSYWVARTIWALGEGYAAFKKVDPAFARFLARRLDLALDALDRDVLDAYGSYLRIDGARAPAWLIADGADASAEAVLGLTAYVEAGGTGQARRTLSRLSEGIARLSGGSAARWPFGALRPWALSRSIWHAWGSQMPAALARASTVLDRPALARAAARDSFGFTPWLLTSGGPDNGRSPTRVDTSQIAYGVDSRVQSLLATADASGRRAAARLAGVTAAWYFGANASGAPTYDPATGVTYDGVAGDGTVNQNSGAESTIHGLLTMLQLDARPAVSRLARTANLSQRRGTLTLQAEDAEIEGGLVRTPDSTWTGEAQYGGTGFAALGDGDTATFGVEGRRSRVLPVVDLRPGTSAVVTFRLEDGTRLGRVRAGDIGRQGDSPAPGALLPRTLPEVLPAGAHRVTATVRADGPDRARLDALMLEPEVSRLILGSGRHGTVLVRSASDARRSVTVEVPGTGRAGVRVYDAQGRPVSTSHTRDATTRVVLPPGGFAVVRR